MPTVHEAVFQAINDRPNYAGLFEVIHAPFDAKAFVDEVPQYLPTYQVVPSSEGEVSIVQPSDEKNPDRSRRGDSFDFHTDGNYLPQLPALFLLACEDPGTNDTKTAFMDSRDVVREMQEYVPTLGRLQFSYYDKHDTKVTRPMIETHPVTGETIMHCVTHGYAEPLVDATTGKVEVVPQVEIEEVMIALDAALRIVPTYVHSWRKGDVIIADNQTFLHARQATTPDPNRRLSRVWLDLAPQA